MVLDVGVSEIHCSAGFLQLDDIGCQCDPYLGIMGGQCDPYLGIMGGHREALESRTIHLMQKNRLQHTL